MAQAPLLPPDPLLLEYFIFSGSDRAPTAAVRGGNDGLLTSVGSPCLSCASSGLLLVVTSGSSGVGHVHMALLSPQRMKGALH